MTWLELRTATSGIIFKNNLKWYKSKNAMANKKKQKNGKMKKKEKKYM